MKHIRQGESECLPSTLAMLTGRDVKKIIAYGLKNTGYPTWKQFITSYDRELVVSRTSILLQRYYPYLTASELLLPCNYVPVTGRKLRLPARRKGTILVRLTDCAGRESRHLVAFKGNRVFDSLRKAPKSFKAWLRDEKLTAKTEGAIQKIEHIKITPKVVKRGQVRQEKSS